MDQARATITIDIVSDVVCPWCIIGYRQLETAIAAVSDRASVELSWHPFELVPGMAPEGQNSRDYMAERYGASGEQARANRDKMVETGRALGIDFAFSDQSRIYNTHKAHELLAWATDSGKQTALKLAFFEAYFTDQANISSEDVLLAAVETVGLNRDEAAAALADGRYTALVDAEIAQAYDQNISGVPAYIVNGTYLIPGAQDSATFERILEKVIGA